MAREAFFKMRVTSDTGTSRYTPASAETEGQVVKINISSSKCVAGVTTADIAANATGTIDVTNIYAVTTAAAQTYALGAQVYWDYEGSKAIPAASANGADDFFIGTVMRAKTSTTDTFVWVRLNWGPSEFVRNASSSSSSST